MKKIILSSLAVLCFASCMLEDATESETVKVFAEIYSSAQTKISEDGNFFTDRDAIWVVNAYRDTYNKALFTYSSSNDTWTSADVLLWEGNTSNLFRAWYPASASYDSFTIPIDQSFGAETADWLTATAIADISDGGVSLSFNHNLVKVYIKVASWGEEYPQPDRKIQSVDLLSVSTIMYNDGETIYGDEQPSFIKTYYLEENSFTALVAPGTYPSDCELMRLNVAGEELTVKTDEEVSIIPGRAYVFRLNVGKNQILLSQDYVSVCDWGDVTLGDTDLEEMEFQLPDGTPSEYEVDFEACNLNIPLLSNIFYNVDIEYSSGGTGWLKYNGFAPGMSKSGDLQFSMTANTGTSARNAQISISTSVSDSPIKINVEQRAFAGIDESQFNPNKYLTYVRNYHSYWSGDDLTLDASYFSCPVSFEKIEFKFQLASAPTNDSDISLGSTNTSKDSYVDLQLTNNGICFVDANDEDPYYYAEYTWSEMGVTATSVMTLALNATDRSVTVNNKKLASDFAVRGLSQLFSNYYRESDDGVFRSHDGFVPDSKLYYVKMWDKQGRLIYLGSASRVYNDRTLQTEACWSSTYYYDGKLYNKNEFAHYCDRSNSYTPFGMGNL